MMRRDGRSIVVMLILGLAGCVPARVEPGRPGTEPRWVDGPDPEQVYARTQRTFAEALLMSPQEDAAGDSPWWQPPLIVQESGAGPAGQAPVTRFGAVRVNPAGHAWIDTAELAVYFLSGSAWVGERDFPQWTYLWYYPPAAPGQAVRYRGFRMVLDSRGFGMIWEILSSEAALRIFYVSERLEMAAAQRHGRPLPGRRFAVEPGSSVHPGAVVARALAEGPQPMGPFVYLDHPWLEATTLLCRCMPPQVEKIVHRAGYRLIRLEDWTGLYAGRDPPPNLPLPDPDSAWTGLLRLPPEL